MASTQVAKFSCSACGRQYPWKAEIAGRSAKCKCGQALTVPATADAEPDPDVIDFADLEAAGTGRPVAAGPMAEAGVDGGYRCPSCSTDLAPGALLCTSCGYNLKTGSRMQTQMGGGPDRPVAATAKGAAGMNTWGGRPGQMRGRDSAGENSQTIKQLVLGGIALVLLVGLIFGAKMFFKKEQTAAAGPMLGDDAKVLEMFKEEAPIEGIAFVDTHPSRTLGIKWTNNQSRNKINQWYSMGAVKVWTFNSQLARYAFLELPQDPEKRKALFQWSATWEVEHGQPAPKDVGQKYIILHMM